jgi:hypothetical protein
VPVRTASCRRGDGSKRLRRRSARAALAGAHAVNAHHAPVDWEHCVNSAVDAEVRSVAKRERATVVVSVASNPGDERRWRCSWCRRSENKHLAYIDWVLTEWRHAISFKRKYAGWQHDLWAHRRVDNAGNWPSRSVRVQAPAELDIAVCIPVRVGAEGVGWCVHIRWRTRKTNL